ncbi:NAD-dependent epimerase/dehydratase family protein [Dactylosporangium sp. NPDC051484]|uniref:NAD-dependent epimerase/dehydratase family protein n=1 Tax=Dactylosporangium sp. NPDC051484 TaxID=3154942 RepID=UPI00344B623C
MSPSDVLIIGSAGYVGTRMSAGFARAGYRVAGLQRPGGTPVDPAYRAVPGDLADPPSLVEAARGFDLVIHLGAILDERLDLAGVDALIEAGSPMIITSGSDVLGAGHVDEDDVPHPHPLVGWRDEVERRALAAGHRVIRPGLIYGSGGGVVQNMMVPLAQRLGAGVYVGEPDVRWGAVHVDDLPPLYLAVARSAAPGTVWNAIAENVLVDRLAALVGCGRTISWPEHEDVPPEYAPIGGLFRLHQVVSSQKTRREMGWVPRHTDAVASLAQELAAAGFPVRPEDLGHNPAAIVP